MFRYAVLPVLVASIFATPSANAAIDLIARGSLDGTLSDLSSLTATPLENGVAGNLLGGIGSGLAWAGGNTFLALPDRGPNAVSWNAGLADTTSYVARFQTMRLDLTPSGGGLPYTVTPTLTGTTLLYSPTALSYAAANALNNNIAGAPSINRPGKFFFSGRSDNFGAGNSLNADHGRLDPEGIRVSADGKSVFVSDEYGPYLYQFDRTTGQRIKAFTLPANLAVSTLGPTTASEGAPFNSSGRVANKGMEGLAITPDGSTLYGFMQSPLLQDGGDGGRANRIVAIDIASGATHEYAYDNRVGTKNFNSSEMLALNDHEFLVLERDGKGLGDGSSTSFKQIYKVDLSGATDVTSLSGETTLQPLAPAKSLFLDIRAVLNSHGITDDQIPAKLEGMAFGDDVMIGGKLKHTLYIGNDNDFLATAPDGKNNPNQWFVFAFDETDLSGSTFLNQSIAAVPEPESYAMLLGGLAMLGVLARRARSPRPAPILALRVVPIRDGMSGSSVGLGR